MQIDNSGLYNGFEDAARKKGGEGAAMLAMTTIAKVTTRDSVDDKNHDNSKGVLTLQVQTLYRGRDSS